jgi:hypothetical protein
VSKLSAPKPSAPGRFAPAGWTIAVAGLAVLGIALAGGLRITSKTATVRHAVASLPGGALKAEDRGRVRANIAALPLAFEANQGQTDPQVKYVARGNGYTVFLTDNDTIFALRSSPSSSSPAARATRNPDMSGSSQLAPRPERTAAIHMQLVGGNEKSQIIAGNQLPGHSNYFIGNARSQWHANVPQYARISYQQAYPGVNLAFYGGQNQLEFDFIVAPGASPDSIQFGISGAIRISTDPSGNLLLASSAGDVLLHKPVAYELKDGARQPVDAHFVLRDKNQVSFELGNYDRNRELVIDPSVTYATYLGGTAEDDGNAIAVDGGGNAYVTGQTKSTNFPTQNALYGTNGGGFDVFVTELSSTGSLVYSTYIGGSSDDSGNAITMNASGNIFVAGGTKSSDFPTKSAYQSSLKGAENAFVLELNSTGSTLMYSTFLGGTGTDVANGLALDSGGDAYVVGSTTSTDFPPLNPLPSETGDGFVTKLNSSGNALVYSTYLGGGAGDFAGAVAVDGSGNAYVTGGTKNPGFVTTSGVFQPKCGTDTGGTCNGGLYDAFVAVINPSGSGFVYSTFLGGESNDKGLGIAVDSAGDAYVTGVTSSTKFPLQSPLQPSFGGGTLPSDAFVTELNPTGAQLLYSTYLGGSGDDSGLAIAVDSNKNAYVTGVTGSTNFPTANPTQAQNNGENDAFVSEISAGGSALTFSTYLGGSLNENTSTTNGGGSLAGIAVDSAGTNVYVIGSTASTDFPTVAAEQGTAGGTGDAFVAKYSTSGFAVTNGALSPASGAPGVSATATITVTSMVGFNSPVTLACSVAPVVPKAPTCSFTPTTPVTPSANGTATATLNLATTASTAMLERPSNRQSSGMVYAMLLPIGGITLLGAGLGSAGSRRKKWFGFLMLGMLLFALLLMPACSSSSSGGGGGGTDNGTPTGTYTITVTGTSGSNVVTGSPALTLTVN